MVAFAATRSVVARNEVDQHRVGTVVPPECAAGFGG